MWCMQVVYLLGADDWQDKEVPKDAFVIYQVGAVECMLLSTIAS